MTGPLDDAQRELSALEATRPEYPRLVAAGLLAGTPLQVQLDDVAQNPERANVTNDDRFRVLVPFSGGLDSTTVWRMVERAGYAGLVVPVYVDTGVGYSPTELSFVRRWTGDRLEVLTDRLDYKRYEHVDRGRNLVILLALAELADRRGWWSEIWFGNQADYGESGVVAGDKSHRFFATVQHLFTLRGLDCRIGNPLGGLSKADIVRWWAGHGEADVLLHGAYSCHDPAPPGDGLHCGRCAACFRRFVAFRAAGVDRAEVAATYRGAVDFAKYTALLRERQATPDVGLAHCEERMGDYLRVMKDEGW